VKISEDRAKVKLQALVHHTTQWLLTLCSDLIISLGSNSLDVQAIFSYGFDGSSGHSAYNQKFFEWARKG